VIRYDAASLGEVLGDAFNLVETRRHDHHTPMGSTQRFQFSVFCRVDRRPRRSDICSHAGASA
jgi:hypothetical protein